MILDDQNTLTHQSAATNDAPRDYDSRPHYIEYCPDTSRTYGMSKSPLPEPPLLSSLAQALSLFQEPAQGCVIDPKRAPPTASEIFALHPIPVPDSTQIIQYNWTQIYQFDLTCIARKYFLI